MSICSAKVRAHSGGDLGWVVHRSQDDRPSPAPAPFLGTLNRGPAQQRAKPDPLDQVERIDSRVSEEPANSFEDRGTEWNRQVIRGQRNTRHNVLRNGVRRHTTPELR